MSSSFVVKKSIDKTFDKTFVNIYISTPGETNTANSLVCFNFS